MGTPGTAGEQLRAPHGCPVGARHDVEFPEIDLLTPLQLPGVRLRHRIVMSPMCQYSANEGGARKRLAPRVRLLLRVAERLRRVIRTELPLFVRISATDWVDGGWDIDQSVMLARRLKHIGVDLIDVSSGGTVPRAQIPVEHGYQVRFARRIRDDVVGTDHRA